uniref:Uncharacterized protein n=1 Tax=Rhizophora mucronata TaxID=61149 RepID=A0A2P2NBP7_RHIMU
MGWSGGESYKEEGEAEQLFGDKMANILTKR